MLLYAKLSQKNIGESIMTLRTKLEREISRLAVVPAVHLGLRLFLRLVPDSLLHLDPESVDSSLQSCTEKMSIQLTIGIIKCMRNLCLERKE